MPDGLTYRMRVRLADRPGALGRITSRIGALRGDVVDLEIVERYPCHAIDDFIVEFPETVPLDLIRREVESDDGVEIESIEPIIAGTYVPRLEALGAAASLLETHTLDHLLGALCDHIVRSLRLEWAVVVDDDRTIWASAGRLHSLDHESLAPGPGTECVSLPGVDLVLVVRRETPLRARESQRTIALARIADLWAGRLGERPCADLPPG